MISTDILIVGAGAVGLAMAATLADSDYQVKVIDPSSPSSAPTDSNDLRVYAINKSSFSLLSNIAATLSPEKITPYRHMTIWDQVSSGQLDFSSQLLAEPNIGHIIHESTIKQALLDKIYCSNNIDILFNHKVEALQQKDSHCIIKARHHDRLLNITAGLVIAADGANSDIRKLCGFECKTTPYSQHAIVAQIACQQPHRSTAFQIFKPEGPLAFLPLKDPHQCSIVWSTTPEEKTVLMQLDESAFCQTLGKAFQHKLGQITDTSQRISFPLLERKVTPYVKPNITLIGDALHTIHPLAGLGFNLGLADVQCLGQLLLDSPKSLLGDIRQLLKYQRARKGQVLATTQLMSLLQKGFSPSGIPAVLRGLGMNWISSTPLLKRKIMQLASGF